MTEPATNPCGSCGLCCRSYLVPVTGDDVWRISTSQRLDPTSFVVAHGQTRSNREGFRLDTGPQRYDLVLDKQGRWSRTAPCVFLLRLAGDQQRCGIYDHRPVVCQAYPMKLPNQRVVLRSDVLCPENGWSEASLRWPSWRLALLRQRMSIAIDDEVIARWNAWLAAAPEGVSLNLADFLGYLINVYDQLDALAHAAGAATIEAALVTWGRFPPPDAAGQVRVAAGQLPWFDYLLKVRAVIDRFFPQIDPLPLLALGSAYAPTTAEAPTTGASYMA